MALDKKKTKGKFKTFNPEKYINVKPVMNEAKKKAIVVSFGRLNPITIGHEKLVNKIISEAAKRRADAALYLSHSQDKNKNPLSYDQKIEYATKAFGKIVRKSSARNIIEVGKELTGKYEDLIVVVGSDRVQEFEILLNKYNGKEYNFDNIEVLSAGERDPDADDVSGMSASKLRNMAAEDNFLEFKRGLPKKLQVIAKEVLYNVRKGMELAEDYFVKEETLDERAPLTLSQRRKRALQMRRIKSRLRVAREKAKRRMASKEKLELRSKRKALQIIRNRLSKKSYGEMSPSEKIALDKRLMRIPQSVIDRIARKQLPIIKRAEIERLHGALNPSSKNEAFEEFYESYCGCDGAPQQTHRPKKYHSPFTKEGKVKFDKRFKMYREKINPYFQESVGRLDLLEDILDLEKSVSEYLNEAIKKEKDDPCWKGYAQLGMKKKGNREVPNCVPLKKESVDDLFETRFMKEQENVAKAKFLIAKEKNDARERHKRMLDVAKRKDASMREAIDKNDPSNREYGTDSLVKILKKDTPGQDLKEYALNAPILRGDRVSFKLRTITGVSDTIQGTVVGTETHTNESDPMSRGRLRVRDDSGKLYVVRHQDVNVVESVFEQNDSCPILTVADMKAFEQFVNRLFDKFGIEMDFTKHFRERMADERNKPCIDMKELASIFQKLYKKYQNGDRSLNKFADTEVVIKDLQSDLNMPVAIEYDRKNDELVVVAKTIMRKKNFSTPNKVLKV